MIEDTGDTGPSGSGTPSSTYSKPAKWKENLVWIVAAILIAAVITINTL